MKGPFRQWMDKESTCENCGHLNKPYAVYDTIGQEKIFNKSKWLNLFKMPFRDALLLLIVVLLLAGYKIDIGRCDAVINNPCGYCEDSGCYETYMYRQPYFNPTQKDSDLTQIATLNETTYNATAVHPSFS